jgi:Raf kinase inhibitor-like YbhB/YbcL family protein
LFQLETAQSGDKLAKGDDAMNCPSWRTAAPAILIGLASCSAQHQPKAAAKVDQRRLAKLDLTSGAFADGQPIPARYGCDGAGEAPALHWGEPPRGTRSFALVVDDPDAPGGIFRHWGVFDIPASARSIGGGKTVGTEVTNDFGKAGYGAPCPPKGRGPHHYHFRLFALDTAKLGLTPAAKVAGVENAAAQHALAEGELVGTYERK